MGEYSDEEFVRAEREISCHEEERVWRGEGRQGECPPYWDRWVYSGVRWCHVVWCVVLLCSAVSCSVVYCVVVHCVVV